MIKSENNINSADNAATSYINLIKYKHFSYFVLEILPRASDAEIRSYLKYQGPIIEKFKFLGESSRHSVCNTKKIHWYFYTYKKTKRVYRLG